ncbi:MAG TPA: M23 family metallopeptidase [Actinomycetota bacterium]|nr:M23 family metallopeptidase [Actinomycetota bacterium]
MAWVRSATILVAAVVLVPVTRTSASPRGTLGEKRADGPPYGTYVWPVHGPVILPFEPPDTPYGPGHRGIDIAVPIGTPVRAAGPGRVAFAGWVAGSLFVSIDHPDGVRTTYSWLSAASVTARDQVRAGQTIGATGSGHPGRMPPHLHFGARVGEVYVDPLLLLGRGSLVGLIHLAPLDDLLLVAASRIVILKPRRPFPRGPPAASLDPRRDTAPRDRRP